MFKHLNGYEKKCIEKNFKKLIIFKKLQCIKDTSNIELDDIGLLLDVDLKSLNPNIVTDLKKRINYTTPFETLKALNLKNDEISYEIYIYIFILEHYSNNDSDKFIECIQSDYMNYANLSFEDVFISIFDNIVSFLGIDCYWKVGNELSWDNDYDTVELNWIDDTFKENKEWALSSNELLIVNIGRSESKELLDVISRGLYWYDCLSLCNYNGNIILSMDFNCYQDEVVTFGVMANIAMLLDEVSNLQKVHQ